MIIKGMELPPEEITITIAPNGWIYKHISQKYAVLLDGVTAENEKRVLYLCDRRDPACRYCDDICRATKNIEHAVGFVRQFDKEYVDERIEGWKYAGIHRQD